MVLKNSYDGLPPVGCDASLRTAELEYAADVLAGLFGHVAAREDVPYNLSTALSALRAQITSPSRPPLPARCRDRLLCAVMWCRAPIGDLFEARAEKAIAAKGFDAIVAMIFWWAETEQQRAARPQYVFSDVRAYGRWLQNACHNLSLLEEIEERSAARRRVLLDETLLRATG